METKKILLIDDEADLIEMLKKFLEEEGYEVVSSCNGKQGLEMFEKEEPDLVLLDLALPGMNGLEVLKRMMKKKKTLVIMITAYKDAEKVVDAFRLGAYDCIFKPFDFDYLKRCIKIKL
mgnify:CR=1 FL=1